MTLYLGNNLISGVATPTEPTRNLGQIIESILPLTDAGLHLLDGALINGSGIYSAFVTKIGDIYDAQPKYSNVTKIGSLTDNDGVLSGFGANNYANIPIAFNPSSHTWESVFKFTYTTSTSVQPIWGDVATNNGKGVELQIASNGRIRLYLSSNGTSNDIASGVLGSTTLSSGTIYYIKISFTGSAYYVYLSTTGTFSGEETTEITITSSTIIYSTLSASSHILGRNVYSQYASECFLGSIDLNESYINVDGSRWWDGRVSYGFTNETQWQSAVTTYGVCGKFVYDSVGNTVRLPKITGILEGTTDATALGDLVQAGLPNITGTLVGYDITGPEGGTSSGALYINSNVQHDAGNDTEGNYKSSQVVFDASRSSSLYKNSFNKVQPQTIKCYYYIVMSTSYKTEIEVDIDEIATDLNGKADIDFTNVNNSGSSRGASWAMPSSTYKDLTIGASGTEYTAPANGWVRVAATHANNSNWGGLQIEASDSLNRAMCGFRTTTSLSNQGEWFTLPLYAGQKFKITFNEFTISIIRFIYAKGSESEAQ